MRTLYLLLSMSLAVVTIAPSAFADKVVVKAKATVASVTAKRDMLNKVRDELRAFAAKPPGKLTAAEQKAYDAFLLKVKETSDGAEALSKKLTDGLKAKSQNLDALSEMGEMESLKLQAAMQRESRAMTAVSNALKKFSDTAGQIIGNMK